MTVDEIKDLVLFCKEHGVSQMKIGETVFVFEPKIPDYAVPAAEGVSLQHPFERM